MKRNVKAAIKKVREKAGLVYDGPLTPATCLKCKARYYWRVVPETCPRPNCNGRLGEKP